MQEMWVRSLGWKDPQEKEMATHSSILAWRILRIEEPQSMEWQRVGHDWATKLTQKLLGLLVTINLSSISIIFVILRVLHKWNHTICNFLRLAFFSHSSLFPSNSSKLLCISVVYFLLISVLWYVHTTVYSTIHLLKDTWVFFSFWL